MYLDLSRTCFHSPGLKSCSFDPSILWLLWLLLFKKTPWRWLFNFVHILSRWFEFVSLWFSGTRILFSRAVPSVQAAFPLPLASWFVMCQSGRKSVILKCLLNGFHTGDSWTGGCTSWRQKRIGIALYLDRMAESSCIHVLYRMQD